MKLQVIVGLCLLMSLGCRDFQEVRQDSRNETEEKNVQQTDADLSLDGSGQVHALTDFELRITKNTEYYTTGPQQGRAPDGTFPEGTKVRVLEKAGSYALVESEEGITAYVSAGSIAVATESAGLR